MTYTYELLTGADAGKTVEVEHSISAPALSELEHNGELCQVKRVISGGTGFILKGGTWARDRYERGIQSNWKDPGDP